MHTAPDVSFVRGCL